MESSSIFKFWRNTTTAADITCIVNNLSNSFFGTDDEYTDDDDSLFDLPRNVFLSKKDFSSSKPSSPISALRSTPKLKFVLFGFRKSSNFVKTDSASETKPSQLTQLSKMGQSGLLEAPVTPVLARENSLRSRLLDDSFIDYECDIVQDKSVPTYAKFMKHFSPKGSKKRNVIESVSPVSLSPRKFSEGNKMNSFKMGSKNLEKSRPASATVEVAPPFLRRRDDCLLDDVIQGAILHCKKSLHTKSHEFPSSLLSRSTSDPCEEKF